jgi:hypothetical protein
MGLLLKLEMRRRYCTLESVTKPSCRNYNTTYLELVGASEELVDAVGMKELLLVSSPTSRQDSDVLT